MKNNYRMARQLLKLARLLVAAHKTGKFQCMLINEAGISAAPADLSRLMQSTDPREQLVFRNSKATVEKISGRVDHWSKFKGVENVDFREYMWARIEAKDSLISVGNDGTAVLDEKLSEKLHDSYTTFLDLQPKQQVRQEMSTLAGKIRSKSIGVGMLISEIQDIKEKFNGMTVNNRLPGGEADAWDRLEQAGGVQAGPYTVYTINDFKTMSAVAGLDPVTNEDKTSWCVAHENSYFEDYGAPYYLFAQGRKPVMLLNDNDHQIKDVDNEIVQDGSMLEAVMDFLVNHLDYAIAPDGFEYDGKEDFMPNDYYVLPRMIIKDENHVGFLKAVIDECGMDVIDEIESDEILDKLSRHDDLEIRVNVAKNCSMTDGMLAKMAAENDDYDLIYNILENENTGPETYAALAAKDEDWINETIAERRDLPEAIMMDLARRGVYQICDNPDITAKAIETLYELHKDENIVNEKIAETIDLPEAIMMDLARKGVHRICDNPDITAKAIETMYELHKDDYDVREDIAYCDKTPEWILRELAEDDGEHDCMAYEVAYNSSTPKDLLMSLSGEYCDCIARNDAAPAEAVAKACDTLLGIENPSKYNKESIEKIAVHPNASEDTLVKLTENAKSGYVSSLAARNPNLGESAMRRIFSENNGRHVSIGLAENPNTPPDILDVIAKNNHDDWMVQQLVKNPNISDDTIKGMIEYAADKYGHGSDQTLYSLKSVAARRFGTGSYWEDMMWRRIRARLS